MDIQVGKARFSHHQIPVWKKKKAYCPPNRGQKGGVNGTHDSQGTKIEAFSAICST